MAFRRRKKLEDRLGGRYTQLQRDTATHEHFLKYHRPPNQGYEQAHGGPTRGGAGPGI